MPAAPQPLVATILPPHEGFGPASVGAVGTVARLLAGAPGFPLAGHRRPPGEPGLPRPPVPAVRPALWWPGNVNIRYGAALARPLARRRARR